MNNTNDIYKSMIASLSSAIITKTITNPLERVKILQQVQYHYSINKYNNIYNSLKYIIKNESVKGLFKGNIINILRVAPAFILKFEFNKQFNNIFVNNIQNPHYYNYLLSGICTGVSQILITYPIETIRTLKSLDNNMYKNNSILYCIKDIYNKKGLNGYYTGLPLSLFAGSLFIGTQFSIYNYMKNYYTDNILIAGVISGSVSLTLFYWGDSIKRNLHVNIINKTYSNTYNCIKFLGFNNIYAGYKVALLKICIESPIQFYIYEHIYMLFKN